MSKLSIIWEKLVHDLTLYERPPLLAEGQNHRLTDGYETTYEEEERLHTEL